MAYKAGRQRRVKLHAKNCTALILAGGVGKRLKPLTEKRCKPAVAIGGKYRIIDFTLSNCMNSGIRTVGVITQYKSWELWHHVQNAWGHMRGEFGDIVSHMPAEQTDESKGWYQGTADAVYQNLDKLQHADSDYVMVLSGDHIYKMDYSEMLEAHIASEADITVGTITVPLESASRFGVCETNADGRVLRFHEKPETPPAVPNQPDMALASMGIYVFSRKKLIAMLEADHNNPDSQHDFGHNIIPQACESGKVMSFAFSSAESNVQHYWRDVGTLDAYYEANMDLVQPEPDLNLYDTFWPIWTYQESAPPAKFTFENASHGIGQAIDSLVSAGCMIVGGQVKRSVLSYFCTVKEQSIVHDSMLLPNVTIGRQCTIKRAILEEGCKVPDGMEIGVDAELDRQRFHITDSGLAVVTPDALARCQSAVKAA